MNTKVSTCFVLSLWSVLTIALGQESSSSRYIIQWKSTPSSTSSLGPKGTRLKSIGSMREEVWTLDRAAAEELQQSSAVAWMEPDHRYEVSLQSNDPELVKQWALENLGQSGGIPGADIHATEAWEWTTGSDEAVVGLIDSGVDWAHPDLVENIWHNTGEDIDGDGHVLEWINGQWQFDPDDVNGIDDDNNGYIDDFIGWDFVNNDNDPRDDHIFGHGTHVAGIIAARGNNGIGISGVSWYAKIMCLKFLNQDGTGFASDAAAAVDYAIQMGADLTNNSWGGGANNQTLHNAIDQARQHGQPFVAAAGNNFGNNNDRAALYPASYPLNNIISVTATDNEDRLPLFANIGPSSVDLAAPGYAIYSTLPNDGYGYLSGTSMAAPYVSGAICLFLAASPNLGYQHMISRLVRTADKLPSLEGKCVSGGRLNLRDAIQRPIRFQRLYDYLPQDSAVAISKEPNGNLLLSRHGGQISLLDLDMKGQTRWAVDIDPGNMPDQLALATAGTSAMIASIGQELRLYRLDSLGNMLQTLQSNAGFSFSHINLHSLPHQDILLLAASPTGILLARLDSSLQTTWAYTYDMGLSQTSIQTLPNGDILMSGNSNAMPSLIRLDSLGNVMWSQRYALSSATSQIAMDLGIGRDAEGAPQIMMAGFVDNQVFLLPIEEDGEVESALFFQVPDAGAKLSLIGQSGAAWAMATGSQTETDMKVWSSRLDGTILWSNSYAPAMGTVRFQQMANIQAGELAVLGERRLNGESDLYLIEMDALGRSGCLQADISISSQQEEQIVKNSLSLTQTPTSLTFTSIAVVTTAISPNEQVFCDNSACLVEAYFEADQLVVCEDGNISLNNLSIGASAYEWRANGILFSTLPNPIYQAVDEGIIALSLTAIEGQCIDEFSVSLTVEPEIVFNINDTIVCANSVRMEAGIEGMSYVWLDDNEDILGTESSHLFSTSGTYELEITDACGNSESSSFQITLQNGCMWPGDVNTDGEVNMLDYLLLGLVHGQSGLVRPNATTTYVSQSSSDWPDAFPSSNPWAANVNLKHADSDGDGLIDLDMDGQVIRQNASPMSQLPSDSNQSPISLFLQVEQSSVNVGDSISFSIYLEDPHGGMVEDAYGLAFSLNYNIPIQFAPLVETSNSWLNPTGNATQSLSISYPNRNRYDVGITRGNQLNMDGNGLVANMCCITIVIEDIDNYSLAANQVFLSFRINEAVLIRNDGSRISVNQIHAQGEQGIVVNIPDSLTTSVQDFSPPEVDIRVFPNPNAGEFSLQTDLAYPLQGESVLTDLMGRLVWRQDLLLDAGVQQSHYMIPELSQGLYFLQIRSPQQSFKAIPVWIQAE